LRLRAAVSERGEKIEFSKTGSLKESLLLSEFWQSESAALPGGRGEKVSAASFQAEGVRG
jgi:hypothetical protein